MNLVDQTKHVHVMDNGRQVVTRAHMPKGPNCHKLFIFKEFHTSDDEIYLPISTCLVGNANMISTKYPDKSIYTSFPCSTTHFERSYSIHSTVECRVKSSVQKVKQVISNMPTTSNTRNRPRVSKSLTGLALSKPNWFGSFRT